MAAKSNTGLHIALILSVMLAIIGGVFSYIFWDNNNKSQGDLDTARSSAQARKDVASQRRQQLDAVRDRLGYGQIEVGQADPQGGSTGIRQRIEADIEFAVQQLAAMKNTAAASIRAELDRLSPPPPTKPTMRDALEYLTTAMTQLEQTRANEQARAKAAADTTAAAETDRDSRVASSEAGLRTVQDALKVVEKNHQENVNREITSLNTEKTRARNVKDATEKDRRTMQATIDRLKVINSLLSKRNNFLTEKLDNIVQVNFDKPDGRIDYVDQSRGIVWINLGSNDNLQKRLKFSVYRRSYQGRGEAGNKNDLKGEIEIVRVLRGNQAEGRIVAQRLTDPLAVGDPIFTPLWSPGQKFKFAFAFKQDLDGDGTDDWEKLKSLVLASNGLIGSRLDNQGRLFVTRGNKEIEVTTDDPKRFEKERAAVDVSTMFLVVGEKPSQPNSAALNRYLGTDANNPWNLGLKEWAQLQGVRIVSLSDFAEWMGFKLDRRLFRGDKLDGLGLNGAPAANEIIKNRAASGRTLDIFSRNGN